MPEVVSHGESGFVCDTAEEVEEIIKSDKIDSIESGAPRRWAEGFGTERMTEGYLTLFEEISETGGW